MAVVGSFRQRILDLADEHQALQTSFESLQVERDDLRARLASSEAKLEELQRSSGTGKATDDLIGRDLLDPAGSPSPLRLRDSPHQGDLSLEGALDLRPAPGRAASADDLPARGRAAAAAAAGRKDGESDGSSSSYSGSVSPSGRGKHDGGGRRRNKTRRRERGDKRHGAGGTRRRTRRHEKSGAHGGERGERAGRGGGPAARSPWAQRGRSRSRGRVASRSRSRRVRLASAGNIGSFGTGDHRLDLDSFITKNILEARVAHALRTMSTDEQKKVMGTDGGENSFLLVDRVKCPNAVVMSRIRRLEQQRGG